MFKSWKSRIQSHYSYSSTPSFVNDHWSIYQGKSKSKPDLKVSVHIFDKKKFESLLNKNGLYKKSVVAEIYDFLRLQISNLTKFKHPLFLNILEPFEESSSKIIIVSEYISNSLANYPDLNLSELEILKGLLQISKALNFLNSDAKYLHLNLQPSAVLINESNDWKLSSLGFITSIDFDQFKDYGIKSYDPRMPHFISINLDYSAPELTQEMKVYKNTDIWSLGGLIYYVFNNGTNLLNCSNSSNYYRDEYNKFDQQLLNSSLLFKKIPSEFHPVLLKMLQKSPMMRMESITEFIQSSVFSSNKELSCLIYLDEEFTVVKDEIKLEFLTTTLFPILDSLPKDLKVNKILNFALSLMNSKQNMLILPIIYQIIFKIGLDELSNLSFHDLILTKVYLNLPLILTSHELTLVVLSNLEQIQQHVTNNEDQFIKFIKQLFSKTLELDTTNTPEATQTTIKSLELTPVLLNTLDFPFLKNTIFPKITNLFTKTTSLNVKIQTILAIQFLVNHKSKGIDKFMIKDSVLPLLKSMKARDPKVLNHVLSLYKSIIDNKLNYDDELIIFEILPKLWELSSSDSLKLSDYKRFIDAINEVSKNVQALRLDELRKQGDDEVSEFNSLSVSNVNNNTYSYNNMNSTSNTINHQPVIQPTIQHTQPVIKPKVTPLTLKPSSRSPVPQQQHNFGSNFQTLTPTNNTLINSNIKNVSYDDEFDSFQGYTGSNSVMSPTTQQSNNTSFNSYTNNANSAFNTNGSSSNSAIDWTKESYKSQNINLPPGFGDSLIPSKNQKPSSTTNSFNNGWDNGDSLI